MKDLRALLAPLRAFDMVCRLKGVTRAAETLGVTPGAISQQLRRLEDTIGVALHRKDGRELQLTESGKELARHVSQAFDKLEMAVTEVAQNSRGGRLRVKMLPTIAIKWFVPRLAGFYAAYPEMNIDIATIGNLHEIDLGQADFIVRHGLGDWPDVHFELIFCDELIAVCSPEIAKRISEPKDLLQETILHSTIRPATWSIWSQSVALKTNVPKKELFLANGALCLEAAADGLGITIIQKQYVQDDIARGRLTAPLTHVATTDEAYYLICDLSNAHLPTFQAFRKWVRSVS